MSRAISSSFSFSSLQLPLLRIHFMPTSSVKASYHVWMCNIIVSSKSPKFKVFVFFSFCQLTSNSLLVGSSTDSHIDLNLLNHLHFFCRNYSIQSQKTNPSYAISFANLSILISGTIFLRATIRISFQYRCLTM